VEENTSDVEEQNGTPPLFGISEIHSHIQDQTLSLHKKELATLRILGQFNHGFILASQWKGDHEFVYVIDQHAADERLQLETLWKNLQFQTQKLLKPKKIRVPLDDFLCIKERLIDFVEIGFGVRHSEDPDAVAEDEPIFEILHVPQISGYCLDIDGI
jgi:DNA mismatch repair ATPase MutL